MYRDLVRQAILLKLLYHPLQTSNAFDESLHIGETALLRSTSTSWKSMSLDGIAGETCTDARRTRDCFATLDLALLALLAA